MRTFTQRALLAAAVIGFGLLPARVAFASEGPVGPGDVAACDAFEPDTCPDDPDTDGGGLVCFDGEIWQLCPDNDDDGTDDGGTDDGGTDDGGTDDGGTDDGGTGDNSDDDDSSDDSSDAPVVVNPTFTG